MKSTTLVDLYHCVAGKSGEEITVNEKPYSDNQL